MKSTPEQWTGCNFIKDLLHFKREYNILWKTKGTLSYSIKAFSEPSLEIARGFPELLIAHTTSDFHVIWTNESCTERLLFKLLNVSCLNCSNLIFWPPSSQSSAWERKILREGSLCLRNYLNDSHFQTLISSHYFFTKNTSLRLRGRTEMNREAHKGVLFLYLFLRDIGNTYYRNQKIRSEGLCSKGINCQIENAAWVASFLTFELNFGSLGIRLEFWQTTVFHVEGR